MATPVWASGNSWSYQTSMPISGLPQAICANVNITLLICLLSGMKTVILGWNYCWAKYSEGFIALVSGVTTVFHFYWTGKVWSKLASFHNWMTEIKFQCAPRSSKDLCMCLHMQGVVFSWRWMGFLTAQKAKHMSKPLQNLGFSILPLLRRNYNLALQSLLKAHLLKSK